MEETYFCGWLAIISIIVYVVMRMVVSVMKGWLNMTIPRREARAASAQLL